MVRSLGAAVAAVLVTACRPAAPSFSLLFFNRSPAAVAGGRSWAPDADSSRLIAFDGQLHATGTLTSPRLATPVAVAPLGATLLVSERTGEGVVFDADGHELREWD